MIKLNLDKLQIGKGIKLNLDRLRGVDNSLRVVDQPLSFNAQINVTDQPSYVSEIGKVIGSKPLVKQDTLRAPTFWEKWQWNPVARFLGKQEVEFEKIEREEKIRKGELSPIVRYLPTMGQITQGVIGASTPLKSLTSSQASKLIANANKLNWQDIADITSGKVKSGTKFEAYKVVAQDKELLHKSLTRKGEQTFGQVFKETINDAIQQTKSFVDDFKKQFGRELKPQEIKLFYAAETKLPTIKLNKQKLPGFQEIKKPAQKAGQIAIDETATQPISGEVISWPYIKTSAITPPVTGRQSLVALSKTKPLLDVDVSSFLKTSPSNLKKDILSIQSYSSILEKESQINKPIFDKLIGELAKENGIIFESRLKTTESSVGKVARYLGKDRHPAEIADNIAGQLIIDNFDNIGKIKPIFDKLQIFEIEDYVKTIKSPWGYRGINTKIILPNGGIVELQVHTPVTLKIRKIIHPIYKQWRNFKGNEYPIKMIEDIQESKQLANDIWNKAQKSKPFPKIKTGKEQLAERAAAKTELQKAREQREALIFPDSELENQYQNFKKLNNKLSEDVEQLKANNKQAGPEEIDNILYSQEKTADEVLTMFQERYVKEKQPLPQVPKETKAIFAAKKVEQILSAKDILDRRRSLVKAVQKQFGLSDNDIKSITHRDIRLMDNFTFKKFIDDLRVKAEKLAEKRQIKNELIAMVQERELGNIEAIRKAMKLPEIKNMNEAQLKQFFEVLEPYEKGDVFLGQRKLETINRTELEGVKTWREVKEMLAAKLKVSVEQLDNFGKISEFDRLKSPTALSEKDSFFKSVMLETEALRLERSAEYLQIEKEVLTLAKKLKTTFIGKLIPQQKNIADWFSAKDKNEINITKEEAEVIKYIQDGLSKALDYLKQMKALKKGMNKDFYYPYTQRGFLETLKDSGVKAAFRAIFDQQRMGEAPFEILDKATGEILSYDKFFSHALHRTGKMIPTENVVKAFLTYMKKFKEKQALDEIVPLIEIYSESLTPPGLTKKGVLLHGNLVRFMKEWLNTQKGRHITLVAKQGGKIDFALKGIRTFTYLWDLGLNIPVSLATQVGEQVVQYKLLGAKKYALVKVRALTPQGRKITEKYRNFIGKSVWTELFEPHINIADRLNKGIFGLFQDANVRRNRNFLLGSLTKEEFKTGEVSSQRLADLKLESGRYAMIENAKSIIGATPEGRNWTQYKSWALQIVRSELKNISDLQNFFKTSGDKEKARKAFVQLRRSLEIVGIVLILKALFGSDEDDNTFLGKMKTRAYKEAMTVYQALSPDTWFMLPRVYTFTKDITDALWKIITLERYEKFGEGYKKGDLKGVQQLQRIGTPRAIKQFEGGEKKPSLDDLFKGFGSSKNKSIDSLFEGLGSSKNKSINSLFEGL